MSVVDSGNGQGPLHMMNYGVDNATRKRYNVAASRARDQLWVIDSLDSTNDLKPGDIRKILIDYSLNPNVVELTHAAIEKEADSPFEISIATALSDRGYHIVQQWKVGSYRLDIVVVCGNKKVAIECDGERWHSGEEKIREDMERQTILERLGWKFIRIRGSEFYRDSEKAIERVINELSDYSIMPENAFEIHNENRETELLKRVKARAHIILKGDDATDSIQEQQTIAAALDPKSLMEDIDLSKSVEISSQLSKNRIDTMKHLLKPGMVQSGAQTEEFAVCKDEERLTFETLPQLTNKQTICEKESSSKQKPNEKNLYSRVPNSLKTPDKKLEPMSRQLSIFETAKENKKILKKTDGSSFVNELKTHEIEFIDNREQSNIIWIIFDENKQEFIESVIIKYNYRATLEKRGAIATENKPAWRVMIR